ncbi:MAG: NAD-dependent succinate-semialdehyde dehydrogenase [Sphingomonadales bacterium]|nr:NAD-dependent succinate-semialdehyde dehydrogenase [Sphingomonadales bacterium]
MSLNDPGLLREAMLIGGAWVQADSAATIDVRNPATGAIIARVPDGGAAETRRAIDAADTAFASWRSTLAKERAAVLRRFHELILANIDDLALLITSEQGKPLAEARGEIAYAAGFIEWFGEEAKRVNGQIVPPNLPGRRILFGDEAKRVNGQIVPPNLPGRRILVQKAPVGVFAAITPWNFPAAMITRKAGPGWAAGCTGVIKPASQTPLTALALGMLAERAGLPPGVCNVVTGSARAIGGELTANPVVRKLSFTGSTEVGALLIAQCAPTIKRTSMELGGNAPFLVFDDADLETAVTAAMIAKYRNSGQSCIGANRFLVQSGIHDAFAARLAEQTAALKVSHGLDPDAAVGPLIDPAAVAKVEDHVADALAKGAAIACGGRRHALGGTFYEPTVLTGVPRDALVFSDETFGPIAPIFRFDTEEQAIAMANDTPFGLAAYLCARDVGRIFRVVEALEFGMVGVNEGLISTEVAPFGGVKASGIGREGSSVGIEEYLETKYVALGGI